MPPSDVFGQNLRILNSGKHPKAFFQNMWQTILAGKVWKGEIINRRKDGSLYTEDQTITPVRDDRGEISHFIAIKQDITRKQEADPAAHAGAEDGIHRPTGRRRRS